MKIIFSCFVLLLVFAAVNSTALAQRETANGVEVEKDLALLRRDIRAEKKKIIAANVSLTPEEATKFWPVYDQYVAEMTKNNDEFYSVIKDYAANQKTLTEKVVPAMKVARFFQIDRRLYLLLDLQVTSEVPLIVQ